MVYIKKSLKNKTGLQLHWDGVAEVGGERKGQEAV